MYMLNPLQHPSWHLKPSGTLICHLSFRSLIHWSTISFFPQQWRAEMCGCPGTTHMKLLDAPLSTLIHSCFSVLIFRLDAHLFRDLVDTQDNCPIHRYSTLHKTGCPIPFPLTCSSGCWFLCRCLAPTCIKLETQFQEIHHLSLNRHFYTNILYHFSLPLPQTHTRHINLSYCQSFFIVLVFWHEIPIVFLLPVYCTFDVR